MNRAIKKAAILSLLFMWFLSGWPQIWHNPPIPPKVEKVHAITCGFGSDIGGNQCRGYITSGTTWNVPSDWNSSNNSIEAIGAGGNGANGVANTSSGGGGGGGEYRESTAVSLTQSSTVDINIPSGGDGSSANGTWVKNGAGGGGTIVVEAKNGSNGSGTTAGSAGTGGTGAAANYNGGTGGVGRAATARPGGGGGGSAGPTGIGKDGGAGANATGRGGGGGGGSNGGTSSAGASASSSTGGAGGNGTDGSGSGGGASSNQSGSSGTSGGGGGGPGNTTGSNSTTGGSGGCDTAWDSSYGACGGGGGGAGASGTAGTGSRTGGGGGTYGGGGGGGGVSGASGALTGGTGGQGLIVITYSPIIISVTVTDGVVSYGTLPAGGSSDTTSSGLNDLQTATNDGTVTQNFNIKGQNSGNWTLAASAGSEQYVHQFSTNAGSNWTALTTSYQTLGTSIAASGTKTFDLKVTVPTSTSSYTQQSIDVMVQAVQY